MSDKLALVAKAKEHGFFLSRGVGGAEQLRRKVKGGKWLVLTAEHDTLAIPLSLKSRAALALLPEHPDENPDPETDVVYETVVAALESLA